MDNLKWFKFSPVDWVMGKIQKVPETTQLRFIRLMCLYWNKECFLTYDDAEVEIDKEHLDLLISKRVVKVNDGEISIDFLDEQMENVGELREKRREAAMRRWNKEKQNDAKGMQMHASALQDNAEKRREEESREEKIIEENNIINNSAFAKNCLEQPQWCETVCMQNKIPMAELKNVVDDFEKHLITTGDQKNDLSDFKRHFSNWVLKQTYSFNTQAITSGTNQLQPNYDDD